MNSVNALGDRHADLAACVSHGHSWVLAAHVEKNVTYLDKGQLSSGLTKKRKRLGNWLEDCKGEKDG